MALRAKKVFFLLCALAEAVIHPADPGKNISWPYHSFKTVAFNPPLLNITHHVKPSSGYLFFAPDGATEVQLAPLIVDMDGNLVWNGPHEHAFSFGKQIYNDKPVLIWWNGTVYPEPIGRGNGVVYMYNNNYEQIHMTTLPGNFLEQVPGATYPSNIDLHEALVTKNGSLIVTANNVTTTDLSSVGGPSNGWVVNGFVYEIDIATNKVLFSWNTLDHLDKLPFTDSYYPIGSEGETGVSQSVAWGYFHVNAVDPYDGGYIISSRYFCSAVAISKTGEVKWRLDGRQGGDFKLVGNNTNFCYQHDIRVASEDKDGVTLHMHDNHNSPIENGTVPTSGKVIHLDFQTKEATLVQRFLNESGPIYSTAQGNFQPLENGNVFLGHGWIPVLEEYSASGNILTTIQFGEAEARPGGGFVSPLTPTLSYRAFKQDWVGCPVTKPDVVAETGKDKTIVYVSWNGATEVESWDIHAGNSERQLHRVKTVKKHGFETHAEIPKAAFVQVKPILKHGSECKAVDSAKVKATQS